MRSEVEPENAAVESGLWFPESAEAYHADVSLVSHSSLKVFRESRPLYYGQFVAKTIARPEPTAAMLLGTVVHSLVLEGGSFSARYAVAPKVDRRTKEGKAAWERFLLASKGRTAIDEDQYEQANRIADGIRANPFAAELLDAAGRNEVNVRWQDEASGVGLKARFDRLLDAGIVLDLKTASDPSPEAWARQAYNLGYHRQAALYVQGREAALALDGQFLHIVAGTTEPYECIVAELDYDALQLGRRDNDADLAALAECRATGDFSSPYTNRVNSIGLPAYAYTKRETVQ